MLMKICRIFEVFGIIFFVLTVIFLVFQNVLFSKYFFVSQLDSSDIHALGRSEQNFLLLRVLDIIKDEPHCNKLIEKIQKTVTEIENIPVIYLITPTYERPVQKADLTRMSQTLLLVPNIHWIVIEDSENKTDLVTNFLVKTTIPFTHLNVPTPHKLEKKDPKSPIRKGVAQRNLALDWLRNHTDATPGVVYFADDDNTYDVELFEEMRYTRMVSIWPVGVVGGLMVERPLVSNGKVTGWNAAYKHDRTFPTDMAGFAVNLTLLIQNPEAGFSFSVPEGLQESTLLESLVTTDDLEPKADNCTRVLVWHTKTQSPNLNQEKKLNTPSNFDIEV